MYNDDPTRSNPNLLTRRTIPNKNSVNKPRSYQQNQSYPSSYGTGYNAQQGRRPANGSSNLTINNGGRQFNPIDRVMRQNDIIIKLLTEIRSRLPAAPKNDQYAQSVIASLKPLGASDFSAQETAHQDNAAECGSQEMAPENNAAESFANETAHEDNNIAQSPVLEAAPQENVSHDTSDNDNIGNAQQTEVNASAQGQDQQEEEDNFNR